MFGEVGTDPPSGDGGGNSQPWSATFVNCLRIKKRERGFPGGAVVKNPPANAGDTHSSPGPGRSRMPQSH